MLYRGTTPYHSFTLPLSIDEIVELYVTYWQNGEVVLEKDINDVELTPIEQDNNSFITDTNIGDDMSGNNQFYEEEEIKACQATVHLTQEDTLKFKFYPAAEKNIAAIQIRVLDGEDEAYASEVINERIYGVLKDGVI
jgi:hypothetical protein